VHIPSKVRAEKLQGAQRKVGVKKKVSGDVFEGVRTGGSNVSEKKIPTENFSVETAAQLSVKRGKGNNQYCAWRKKRRGTRGEARIWSGSYMVEKMEGDSEKGRTKQRGIWVGDPFRN